MTALAATSSTVSNASSADVGTVQGVAAMTMLKKSINVQQALAAQLIAALPQPALAASGAVGTHLNTFA